MDAMSFPADPLLASLREPAGGYGEKSLERLVTEHAVPVIDSIVRRRGVRSWIPSDSSREEIVGEVIVRLLQRLRTGDCRELPPIANFNDYVAVITHHVVHGLMRRIAPQRAMLKNRIRYVLRHDHRFTHGVNDRGEIICALEPNPGIHSFGQRTVQALSHLIAEVLQERHACELDILVDEVATRSGIADYPVVGSEQLEHTSAGSGNAERTETMDLLRRLWPEIIELPPPQRIALLLSLRDEGGDSVLALLPTLGIATTDEIRSILGLTRERIAAIWDKLPLPDTDIAEMLRLTRQQVINLRKSARDRLHRRIKRMTSVGTR